MNRLTGDDVVVVELTAMNRKYHQTEAARDTAERDIRDNMVLVPELGNWAKSSLVYVASLAKTQPVPFPLMRLLQVCAMFRARVIYRKCRICVNSALGPSVSLRQIWGAQ
jgi:hypothetical protein